MSGVCGAVRRSIPAVGITALLMMAGTAHAEVRDGSIEDAQDNECYDNVDGSQRCEPFDLERVAVSYDTAGRVIIAARFFGPLPASAAPEPNEDDYFDPDEEGYDETAAFSLTMGTWDAANRTCDATLKGSLRLRMQVAPPPEVAFTLVDYEGSIPASTFVSADRRDVVVSATHGALAGRDWNCAKRVTVGYDESTDAPIRIGRFPACDDGLDNDGDGQVDREDWGCVSPEGADERLSAAELPMLTFGDARNYVDTALRRRFGSAYRYGYVNNRHGDSQPPFIGRCLRFSSTKANCAVVWYIGDTYYHGRATIWYRKRGEDVRWNYAYRIKRVDEYCKYVTKGRHCTKTYVVR